ncbi:DUF3667 domain-containing protein [Phaeocystidibacter marisrubri]|uniref:DUF3667 domain-containing protein n=1 Tax=Phaeocystidibacter marisrubri TaxID=1577780 RepID=A0A6L3ZK68_9FLAO|nr:DUF3667 domain-containing protein [Phaeocystidibacter marisrubri]KAB2817540.1 DUF3667 domain-containing protein [Phaeocystidibacter marisrubri]
MKDDTTQPRVCINCSHDLSDNMADLYCPHCGQYQVHKRLTIRVILLEMLSVLTNVERGLWRTIEDLTLRPSAVVKGYWSGMTRTYFNPFRYAFLMATFSALLTLSTGVYDKQMGEMQSEGIVSGDLADQPSDEAAFQAEINQKIQTFIRKYLSFFTLMMIPFGAFCLWLLLKGKGIYLGEHMVTSAYYFGHTSLLGIPLIVLSYYDVLHALGQMTISMVINLVYGAILIKKVNDISWGRTILTVPVLTILLLVILTLMSVSIGFFIAILLR